MQNNALSPQQGIHFNLLGHTKQIGKKGKHGNREYDLNGEDNDKRFKKYGQKKVRPFTKSEDDLIINLMTQYGPKFKRFTKFFKGRNINLLKNRYYQHLRYQTEQGIKDDVQTIEKLSSKSESEMKDDLRDLEIETQESIIESMGKLELSFDIEAIMQKCIKSTFSFMETM